MFFDVKKLILSILSGFFLSMSFMHIKLSYLAWVALTPLFIALKNSSKKESFFLGLITGFVFFLFLLNWLYVFLQNYSSIKNWQYSFLYLIFLLYLGLYVAFFSFIFSVFKKNNLLLLFILPSSWSLIEFSRAYIFTGFPWGLFGYSQFEKISLIQISDLFGVYGVSFVLVFLNVVFYLLFLILFYNLKEFDSLSKEILRLIIILIFMFFFLFSYSFFSVEKVKKNILRVRLLEVGGIQGNIDQFLKWDQLFQKKVLKKYINLSKISGHFNTDLVLLPETSTSFYFGFNSEFSEKLINGIFNKHSIFIIGSPTLEIDFDFSYDCYYNSAYLIDKLGIIRGRYDKMRLVPFGEYSPLFNSIHFFDQFLIRENTFSAGQFSSVLFWNSEFDRLGLLICYESIFPFLSRKSVINGAGILLNLTNDGWFKRRSAGCQHFSMSVFRSIENRKSLLRVANTGISAFVDPFGRILSRTDFFKDEILIKKVPLLCYNTIYTEFGDFFILFCIFILFTSYIVTFL